MSETPRVNLPSIAILGAGSMGRAILGGLLAPGVVVDGPIRVTNRSAASASLLPVDECIVSLITDADERANLSAVEGAAIVLVAVKPAMVPDLLDEIAGALAPGATVVSVVAGVSVTT